MTRFYLISLTFLMALIAAPLSCASATWTDGAANGVWNDNGNWTAAFPNGAADDATLNAAAATGDTINVTSGIDLNSISSNTSYNLTGSTITFNNAGTKINATGGFGINVSIANNLSLPTGVAVTFVSPATLSTFTLSGVVSGTPTSLAISGGTTTFTTEATFTGQIDIQTNATATFEVDMPANEITGNGTVGFNNVTTTYAGDIIGNVGLLKTGTGDVTLSGTNTHTGNSSIQGGSLIGNTTSLSPSTSFSVVAGTLVINQDTDGNLGAGFSGGSVTKLGTGNVTVTSAENSSNNFVITTGTITGTTTSLRFDGGVFNNSASLVFDQNFDGTFLGVINGTGTVTKSGTGTVITGGAHTYSGDTIITAGTWRGTTTSIPSTTDVNNQSVLAFNQDFDGEYSGIISNTGAVTKQGTGNVTFSGNNTYTGGTTISAGTLTGTTSTIPSSGGISNSGTLVFNQGTNGTFSGVISGTGSLTKDGSGTVTLSNTISHTGGTTISDGNLTITGTPPSSGNISIAAGSTLTINTSGTPTIGGNITSDGAFTKLGTGTLTLSGTNTYTGATTVTAGTLSVTGAIATDSTTTVQTGATLRGSGSVGPVVNGAGATVQAGIAAGDTLTINGTYSQTATSTMKSLITTAAASDSTITGIATLTGTLELDIAAGVYPTGTSYTVLTADSITNNFTTLSESHSGNWQLSKVDNTIVVTLLSSEVITPVPLSSLKGNAKVMGEYMFLDSSFVTSNADLNVVADVMTGLSGPEFEDSLIRVSPLADAANPFVTYQNDLQMAIVLDKQFQKTIKNNQEPGGNELCSATPKTGAFIEPIGLFYHQQSTQGKLTNIGQVEFNSYTYGAGMGWEQVFDDGLVLEGGVGYTHSNLDWKQNFGNSRWSTVYFAPFVGWFNKTGYFNMMAMGGVNFFRTHRKVAFQGLERVARSTYISYDILARVNTGLIITLGHDLNGSLWFQPDFTLNYLTIFTDKYTEKDAGSMNLQVKRNVNYILQPSFRGKFTKQYVTKNFCFSPNLYLGWLANILLKKQTLSARFQDAPNQIFFTIQGYQDTTNQLVTGFEFYIQRFDQFIFTTNFEADVLSYFEVYSVKMKFQWMF